MICPKCGREIPEGAVCPCAMEPPVLSSNPALNVLKTLGSSTLFLLTAILMTVSQVLSFVSQAVTKAANSELLSKLASVMGMDGELLFNYQVNIADNPLASAVGGAVPGALLIAAMWIHYATCRSRQSGNISTAGLTICQVMHKIAQVCLWIAVVAMAVALLLVCIFGADSAVSNGYVYGNPHTSVVGIVFLFLILSICLGLAVAWFTAMVRTIKRAKTIALTGMPDGRVSKYLTGLMFAVGGLGALGALGTLFLAPMSGVTALCQAAYTILAAILLCQYRRQMTALQYQYQPVQPVYAPPVQGCQSYPGQTRFTAPAQTSYPQGPAQPGAQPPQYPTHPAGPDGPAPKE